MRTVETLQNRIDVLKNRQKDNGKIIKKCERQIRALQKKEQTKE